MLLDPLPNWLFVLRWAVYMYILFLGLRQVHSRCPWVPTWCFPLVWWGIALCTGHFEMRSLQRRSLAPLEDTAAEGFAKSAKKKRSGKRHAEKSRVATCSFADDVATTCIATYKRVVEQLSSEHGRDYGQGQTVVACILEQRW